MEASISLILICLAIMFCIGISCGIFSIILTKKHKHPIISILISIICWLGLSIPTSLTLGFMIGILAIILFGIYVITIIISNIKNIRNF